VEPDGVDEAAAGPGGADKAPVRPGGAEGAPAGLGGAEGASAGLGGAEGAPAGLGGAEGAPAGPGGAEGAPVGPGGLGEPPVAPGDGDLWPLFFDRRHPSGPGRDRREQRIHQHVRGIQNRGRQAPRRVRSLSRDEIVAAAIKVADAEGSEAISMRRIAREMGAGAMSLYWHIASKEELLDLMLDAVEGEGEFRGFTGDWRTDLRAIAMTQRSVLHRHQWLMDFIGGRPPLGPNTLRNLERAMAATDTMGLDITTTFNVLSTLFTYVMGAVLREFRESKVQQRDQEQLSHLSEAERHEFLATYVKRLRATGQFPHFLRIFDEGLDPDAPETRDERFEFGLECVLDGIAARLPGGGSGQPAGQEGGHDDERRAGPGQQAGDR
jgi:AcrR family transcriptional regulator